MSFFSKVETVGDFSFIKLESDRSNPKRDLGIPEENWCQKYILKQLDEFKKANSDKHILSFQVDKWSHRGEKTYVCGIYVHHEQREGK